MKDQLPTGAYVIRNEQKSTVLHVKDISGGLSDVIGSQQDENRYREQQIWWIEPCPSYKNGSLDPSEKVVSYSITNISSGRALDLNPKKEQGQHTVESPNPLTVYKNLGSPWQKWRIERINEKGDESYYKIISAWNEHAASLQDTTVKAVPFKAPFERHSWEFIIPVISFPPGWFQIKNAESGDCLTQTYLGDPLILIKTAPTIPSQYRESWATQWCLRPTDGDFPSNTWFITNRLTGGFLTRVQFLEKWGPGGNLWGVSRDAMDVHPWRLEIDQACTSRWKIVHHATGFLIEQMTNHQDGCMGVTCHEKRFNRGNKAKTWYLTPPVVEPVDEDGPPEYNASTSAI